MKTLLNEPRLISDSNHRNPSPNTGLDTDKLTQQELLDAGYRLARDRHRTSNKKKCTSCRHGVQSPISSYKIGSFDLLEKGEAICSSCLESRKQAIAELLKN